MKIIDIIRKQKTRTTTSTVGGKVWSKVKKEEQEQIFLAWLKDEVALGQISRVVFAYNRGKERGGTSGNILYRFACISRNLYREGRLKIKL